jgi:hypothetical protein
MARKTTDDLLIQLAEREIQIPAGSRWIHFKDKKSEHPYVVLNLALEEESESVVVVYRREDMPKTFIWTRPALGEKGWLSNVEIEGTIHDRFKRIDI